MVQNLIEGEFIKIRGYGLLDRPGYLAFVRFIGWFGDDAVVETSMGDRHLVKQENIFPLDYSE